MNAYPAEKSILVMDDAPIHCGGRIQDLCNAHGMSIAFLLIHFKIQRLIILFKHDTLNRCMVVIPWLLYLPAYCPKLNLIKMCFSVTKAGFKQMQILENSGPDADWAICQFK
ncbi:hypothetical protein CROQUDRAFT_659059, partial [Cronartium quercuum f. sp. fusiforme G11]